MEESQVQYVQFQAASLLKSAVIREWKELSQEQVRNLSVCILHCDLEIRGYRTDEKKLLEELCALRLQIIALRNYLLGYLTSRENMENFVREQMVLVLAITIKRQFVDGDDDVVTNILNDLSQLIMSDEKRLQVSVASESSSFRPFLNREFSVAKTKKLVVEKPRWTFDPG